MQSEVGSQLHLRDKAKIERAGDPPTLMNKLIFAFFSRFWNLRLNQKIFLRADSYSYLVNCRQADLLSPCAAGAFVRTHTLIVAPATLHKGRRGETLTARLEMSTAQAVQWDLGDLQRKGTEGVSRRISVCSGESYTCRSFI